MNSKLVVSALGIALVAGGMGAVAARTMWRGNPTPAPNVVSDTPNAPTAAGGDSDDGSYDAEQLERVGVRFEPVHKSADGSTIDVVGQLSLNRERIAEVTSHATGRVVKVAAFVGEHVREGDMLAMLESHDIAEVVSTYLIKQAELRTARQHFARLEELAKQRLTTAREVELALEDVRTRQAELAAVSIKMEALDVKADGEGARRGQAPLLSPINGTILRREAILGAWMDRDKSAYLIADMGVLWAELDVFETDLGAIHEGDPVKIDVPSLGMEGLTGEVKLIYSELDSATRMGRVRLTVPNTDGRLRAGLSVIAHVRAAHPTQTIRVPSESVRQREGGTFVLVRKGDRAMWRAVDVGARRMGEVEVQKGLDDNEVVAVAGLGLIAGTL